MTVKELIAQLNELPQHLPVAFPWYGINGYGEIHGAWKTRVFQWNNGYIGLFDYAPIDTDYKSMVYIVIGDSNPQIG